MDIVPVLDIRDGAVVHAMRGERASYAPLQSASIGSSEPVAVLQAMLGAIDAIGLRAPAAYVADLDAIMTGSPQWAVVERLRDASPVPLWVDAGLASAAAAQEVSTRGVVPVIGSESLTSLDGLAAHTGLTPDDWVLSLDSDAQGSRDPAGIMRRPELWPQRVIAMELTRVGSAMGGVGRWLETCMAISRDKAWIAAGGVRDRRDLEALRAAGVAAALVATALHSGSLAG